MKMRKVDDVTVDAGAELAFVPGGLHIMIMGLAAPLADKGVVHVTLTISDGTEVQGSLPVLTSAPAPPLPVPG